MSPIYQLIVHNFISALVISATLLFHPQSIICNRSKCLLESKARIQSWQHGKEIYMKEKDIAQPLAKQGISTSLSKTSRPMIFRFPHCLFRSLLYPMEAIEAKTGRELFIIERGSLLIGSQHSLFMIKSLKHIKSLTNIRSISRKMMIFWHSFRANYRFGYSI